ncbi:M24 family metallopeptidase [Salirhabdus salicampi]|uniref:M24 family metallopeptidase n=1 Tax=Salirhabdus salicampi TaxID=476102 RepID=UPI0020C5104E|nr:Xaa-Pro peptidase family protein [Salirhabdus salicampi]MCP8617114.1 Xaa-Pro peptidase family protein [Salirhabdus salicampi]
MENRIQHLMNTMNQAQLSSAFITSKANIYYLTGYYTEPHERLVALYIDKEGKPLLILPEMEKKDAMDSGWSEAILAYDDQTEPFKKFKQYVAGSVPDNIGVESDHLTLTRYESIQSVFPRSKIQDCQPLLHQLRVIKDQSEYQLLKDAAALADFGVQKGIEAIEEGKSELEIIAHIEYALKREGVRDMSFSTLVLTGNKTSSPHGTPSQTKIKAGDFVLFDLGVVFEGYCSDITRTFGYKKMTEQQKEMYNVALKAQQTAIEAIEIGKPIGQLDQTARAVITEHGYGDYFTHRIGHGLGIDVHEYPSMNSENTLPLEEGMCFTIEPGIYVPNVGGVRIEDDIFMTKKGPELLTQFPKQLQIIGS